MHVVPVVYLNGVRHFPPPAPPPLLPGQRRKSLRDPGTGEEGGSLQQTARRWVFYALFPNLQQDKNAAKASGKLG